MDPYKMPDLNNGLWTHAAVQGSTAAKTGDLNKQPIAVLVSTHSSLMV